MKIPKDPPSEGVCQLCQGTFTSRTITRHLQRCLTEHEPAKGKERKLVHLAIDGYGPYWLHVEMPADATFRALDVFLRRIWLECCGHLSAFRFNRGIMAQLDLGDDFEFEEDGLMDCEVAEVLEPKLAFDYDYDFGSTTKLRLKVAGIRNGKWAGKERVRLLARNLPPEVVCDGCGKPAKWIDGQCGESYCAACAKKAEEEECLLPVVNSPRMGVCGYTGKD